ncbi:MAG TPA: cupredoxin domain-containing protein [Egibacteraceae bacterium]|nr:cupredoxin domain-containing protein [Egibacteraceae bacterium]
MASTVAAPTPAIGGHTHAKWTPVAAFGMLLMAAGMALWIVGGLIAGQSVGGDFAFLFIGVGAPLVGAALTWRAGTVGKILGVLLAAATLFVMFWVAFSLGAPNAFVEFSGAVMFVMGGLTAVGYGVGSIVHRKDLFATATRGETRARVIMVGIAIVAMLVSGVLNFTGRTSVDAAAAGGATPIAMANFEFSPATLSATAGEPTTIVMHNSDAFTHDFVIEALGVNSGLMSPGSQQLIEITAAEPGEYLFRCTLHSGAADTPEEAGMAGMLVVE